MSDSPAQINEYLDYLFVHGPFWVYLVIFGACFVENLFPPFPGDSFIVAGAGLVAVQRLELHLFLPTVIVGGMCSVMLLYVFGRRYGRTFFVRKNYRYFSAADIYRMEKSLKRWGVVLLVFSRFVVGFRSALALVAGVGRYSATGMLIYSTISYFLFAGLIAYIAFAFADNFDLIQEHSRTYHMIVWPVLIALVLAWVIRKVIRLRREKTT